MFPKPPPTDIRTGLKPLLLGLLLEHILLHSIFKVYRSGVVHHGIEYKDSHIVSCVFWISLPTKHTWLPGLLNQSLSRQKAIPTEAISHSMNQVKDTQFASGRQELENSYEHSRPFKLSMNYVQRGRSSNFLRTRSSSLVYTLENNSQYTNFLVCDY